MKLTVISSCIFGQQVFAGFSQIQAILNNETSGFARQLNDNYLQMFDYGCWCYDPATGFGKGRGKPLDEFDRECRNLAHNYECMILETIDGAQGACATEEPWTQTYSTENALQHLFTGNVEGVMDACVTDNAGDSCAVNVCKAEMKFATVAIFATSLDGYSSTKQHRSGFDAREEGSCDQLQKDTFEDFERTCCGAYPNRFPYKKTAGRDCCNDRTYDVNNLQCCKGTLTYVGDLCQA